jgi:hypothetical protein
MKILFLIFSLNIFSQTYMRLTGKIPLCCGGSAPAAYESAGNATGFGCGGGSSGWAGSNGGNGLYGGGGGGAGGNLYGPALGGNGGSGAIVIAYYNSNNSFMWSEIRGVNFTGLAVPAGTSSMRVWAVGGGGGGGSAPLNDGVATSGGAAGTVAYRLFTGITAGQTMTGVIGAGGARGNQGASGATGGNTVFTWTPSGYQMTGSGGYGGAYNNSAPNNGALECIPAPFNGDACAYGGGTFGMAGDVQGSPGGGIGRWRYYDAFDGNQVTGQKGNDSVNVGGDLFLAVTLARYIY